MVDIYTVFLGLRVDTAIDEPDSVIGRDHMSP